MIKASAGGGGKGMRVVPRQDDFLEALQAARREAKAAFGDEHVLLERCLAAPRHIELQLFRHDHGHAVRSAERPVANECVSTCRSRSSPYHSTTTTHHTPTHPLPPLT